METNSLETHQLSHRFSEKEIILKNIDLRVPQGSIYGFLGPNGAGKTTTLKLILGLLKKQQGNIVIFDKSLEENRIEILKNIGSLIESPSLYTHLTARENLLIWQKIYQCPIARIDEVLTIVGLAETGKKKAGKFSLGMKQRLSIAIALLHKPKLLILDEPTNGLDPNGILEMRELLTKINQEEKVTIIISSHLLSEIEKLVTHIGIINKGEILFQGTLNELHEKQTKSSHINFETNDVQATQRFFESKGYETQVKNDMVSIPFTDKETVAQFIKSLVEKNISIYQITTMKNDLESIFIDLTK